MNKNNITRRKLLTDTGKIAASFAIGINIMGIGSCSRGKSVSERSDNNFPEWPWPYTSLDPEKVRKKGHLRTYEGGCSYGAFAAILESLREEIGFPYTQIPAEMMIFGRGGFSGMGSLCGALNGASAAMTLVSGKEIYGGLVKQLADWYTSFEFPSDMSNQYGKDHSFLVETYRSDKVLPTSVANSVNCSDSTINWCQESGYANNSPERAERCSRLVGDVAAQAVIILNEQLVT